MTSLQLDEEADADTKANTTIYVAGAKGSQAWKTVKAAMDSAGYKTANLLEYSAPRSLCRALASPRPGRVRAER